MMGVARGFVVGVVRGVMVVQERVHGGAREGSWWVWLKGSCSCIDNVRAYLLSEEMEDMTLDEASVDKYAYNSMIEVQ